MLKIAFNTLNWSVPFLPKSCKSMWGVLQDAKCFGLGILNVYAERYLQFFYNKIIWLNILVFIWMAEKSSIPHIVWAILTPLWFFSWEMIYWGIFSNFLPEFFRLPCKASHPLWPMAPSEFLISLPIPLVEACNVGYWNPELLPGDTFSEREASAYEMMFWWKSHTWPFYVNSPLN